MFGGLNAEAYDREYTDRALIRRIFKYFAAFRKQLAIIVATTLLMALFGALNPILVSASVQALVTEQPQWVFAGLIVAVLLAGVLNWGANLIRRRITAQATGDVSWRCAAMPSMPRSITIYRSTMSSKPARSSAALLRTRRSSHRWWPWSPIWPVR
jgi:hypothetical protein